MIPQSILEFFRAGKSLPFRSMTYFNFLLEATLAGSVLILVVLVLRRVFRKQIGSRLVYLAWALVAVRLLLPVAIPNPLMDELRPTYSTDAGARPVADQIRVRYHDAMSELSYRLSDAADESGSQFQKGLSQLTHEVATYSSYGWLGKAYLLLYVIGGSTVLAVFTTRHIRFRRRLKRNTVSALEGSQLELYQLLCERLKIKPIPVYYVDPLPSPCLVGVIRPMIALPLTLPPDALSEALLHELYHYKTGDPWFVLVRCLCCAVHWFNPLVWLAQRVVRTDCELSCDSRVAARLTQDERLHYANTLVVTAKRAYMPSAGVLATGMTMTGKRLKRRVNDIVHMKAVRKTAAAIVACALVLMTVAAFSTAESTARTRLLTSDRSAFPFEAGNQYPMPDDALLGQPVALTPLTNAAEAEAQAKRYLLALYPDDHEMIESECRYRINVFAQTHWEVVVWPPEGGETPRYYMELGSSGRLVSVDRRDLYGDEQMFSNSPSVLPDNLTDVLLAFGNKVAGTVLQGVTLDRVSYHGDMESANGRMVVWDMWSADNNDRMVSMTAQIAPSFRFLSVYHSLGGGELEAADPVIGSGAKRLIYSKDASIAFDAEFWGDADSQYVMSPDAVLTVQQAFDVAVDAMLAKSGLGKDELLKLPLEYGYYDKSNFDGLSSVWRFVWYVEKGDHSNRYWVDFQDVTSPDASISMPGEGLG